MCQECNRLVKESWKDFRTDFVQELTDNRDIISVMSKNTYGRSVIIGHIATNLGVDNTTAEDLLDKVVYYENHQDIMDFLYRTVWNQE